ncbi:hypothetical protein EAE96_006318 [Botrytis aclada]|nr:hypothetical protein EAE96_006318 [Botrytis aclada]
MSGTNGFNPDNTADNSIPSPQAAPPVRSDPHNELDPYDIPAPGSPPPAYSRYPPPNTPNAPAPPPYINCTCLKFEQPRILVNMGFRPELADEIWNRWQLHTRHHPEVYQGLNPQSRLYTFFSFVFQATQLPFAIPDYDPRRFQVDMYVYLNRWGISFREYCRGQWDEAQRIASCVDATARWVVLVLTTHCLGHPRPACNNMDVLRFRDLRRMAMAARSVL